ncbi:MAG: hypothetical protein R3314_14710 [Longimicrobiales bacterium]|nr:hypothetical protein [Longimicrobiales bacterium]
MMLIAGCASAGVRHSPEGSEAGAGDDARTVTVEVTHNLAREGALVIWLARENERWARQLGRIIPPNTRAFNVEIPDRNHPWVLGAARATNPRIPILQSRRFTISDDAQRVFWDLTSNFVRTR